MSSTSNPITSRRLYPLTFNISLAIFCADPDNPLYRNAFVCTVKINAGVKSISIKPPITCNITLFFLIIINIRTAFRSRKIFFKQKEAKAKKVIVLREGVFQRIPWKYVLRGDIVRLKKGEQISSPVISLTKPYKEYQSGQVFTENTGRAIVIHTMDSLQEDLQWDDSNLRDLRSGELQEDVQIEHSQLEACGVENTTLQEKFSSTLKKVEEQILDSLCIFMCLSVVISLYIHQEGNMRRILEVGSLFIAVFMIGKVIVREVFRRYAKRLEKINNT